MKGLYNKVIKGIYTRIPDEYTDDLVNIIDMCLKVQPSSRPTAAELLRKKEVVLRLREFGIDNNSSYLSLNLLDTIKLPSDMKLIKDRLPTPKYTIDHDEEMKIAPTKKFRGYSARSYDKRLSEIQSRSSNRDVSLIALKKYQRSPGSIGEIRINKVDKKETNMMLPPKSNRPAGYNNKLGIKPSLQLPPLYKPAAGIPSLGARYRSNSRNRSENRVLPLNDHHSINSSGSDRGYKRRIEQASRVRLQQQLINKAFGLPITPIKKIL